MGASIGAFPLRRCAASALAVVLSIAIAFIAPVPRAAADPGLAVGEVQGQSVSTQAKKKTGWENTAAGKVYFKNGVKVVGLQNIGGKRYYFSSNGILRTHDVTVGGATFYVKGDGQIFGAKYGGAYYYGNLRPMTGDDAFDFDTFIWARSIVDGITDGDDSPEDKRWKAFCWVRDKSYAIHQDFSPYQTNWPAVYARYHFADQGGDCHSDGAAFAYLAAAIGYDADVCIDSWGTGYAPSHCWAMIGDAVYDPLFYESKSTMYYGATSGTYETTPTARFRVPSYDAAHNRGAQASQALLDAGKLGLKRIGGSYYYFRDGKMARNTWKTIDGRRYYFKKNGAAATLSTKIGGTYYVFSTTGVLQRSKKSGKRIVTFGKQSYQVTKSGKAAAGWSKNRRKYAKANGLILKNAWKTVDGSRYYFAKDGVRVNRSAKVAGTYYVFGVDGALQKGAKGRKTTLVRVGKSIYRVNSAGQAVSSARNEWLTGDMQRFDKTGLLLRGVWYRGGKFYAASSAGKYLPEATTRLNAAIKGFASGKKSAIVLRRALDAAGAKLKSEMYSASCEKGVDYDGLWEYGHFAIMTARSKAVKKLYDENGYRSVADAIAALDERARVDDGGAGEGSESGDGADTGSESSEGTDAGVEPGGSVESGGEEADSPEGNDPADDSADNPVDDSSDDPANDHVVDDLIAPDGSYEYIRSITAL